MNENNILTAVSSWNTYCIILVLKMPAWKSLCPRLYYILQNNY